jgi:hypothetical protein
VYSSNKELAYKHNISDKIRKLESQIIRWLPRFLSVEGKILIVKTFGLSQLTYSLQLNEIRDCDIKKVELIIYKFLWNKRWVGNPAPDRIRRSTLKLDYSKGGLKAPNIKELDYAIKTKQFIRAMESNHDIRFIQMFQLEQIGYFEIHKIEYAKLHKDSAIVKRYQEVSNMLCDSIRENNIEKCDYQTRVNVIASTELLEYFRRKNILLILLQLNEVINLGIENVLHLLNESRYPRNDRIRRIANGILSFFPPAWIDLIRNAVEIDSDESFVDHFPGNCRKLVHKSKISVKNIKCCMRNISNNPLPRPPYENIEKFELDNELREKIHS